MSVIVSRTGMYYTVHIHAHLCTHSTVSILNTPSKSLVYITHSKLSVLLAHARAYIHTYITCNQYIHKIRLCTYQRETNNKE